MDANRILGSTAGCPLSLLRVLTLLAQAAFVSASVVPVASSTLTKRDTVTNFLQVVTGPFTSSLPTTSANVSLLMNQLLGPLTDTPYTVPSHKKSDYRAASIAQVRENFVYGPPVGGGPYYPEGEIGLAKIVQDNSFMTVELDQEFLLAYYDGTEAENNTAKYNGLKTLDDYAIIFEDQWLRVMPKGQYPGVKTNYTQDLYFSMQRLANSPFQIRRLKRSDTLAFDIDDDTARAVSGMTLQQLFKSGRLFYTDHRNQALLETTDRYHGACDAYFYIDKVSGDFLPLAIRTNINTSLIYTPVDSANDWLLAKIAFNVNDFWFAQWNHLASTHEVVQIIFMAAIRTLSHEHPVFAIFNRIAYEAFSIQPLAEYVLFHEGTLVDLVFPFTGAAARNYSSALYESGGAGRFQTNYFERDLRNRGLILENCESGPPLKHFPFYEDAKAIDSAVRKFLTAFITSYYEDDKAVAADEEIQAWVAESNGPAKVIDFPARITSRKDIIDVLSQLAYLATSAHHAVNTNTLLELSTALPFSPFSLYRPMPTEKSTTTDPASYLPPFEKVVEQVLVGALFARPLIANSNRTIIHMFDNQTMLSLMNEKTREANEVFKTTLTALSAKISGRTFDSKGLSQGAPFIWTALDPNVAPYSLTV